jgi:protein-S-isoprenylcysteine O-methyltransferase Ste14
MRNLLLPPVVFLLCVVLMVLLHTQWPLFVWLPRPWGWAGAAPIVAGLALAQWHARLFKRLGTNIHTFGEPGQLTTEGLFGRTRNPMYLGMLLALAGVAVVLGSLSPLAVLAGFFVLMQAWYIPFEEQAMAQRFGEAYRAYREQVPRWWSLGRRPVSSRHG